MGKCKMRHSLLPPALLMIRVHTAYTMASACKVFDRMLMRRPRQQHEDSGCLICPYCSNHIKNMLTPLSGHPAMRIEGMHRPVRDHGMSSGQPWPCLAMGKCKKTYWFKLIGLLRVHLNCCSLVKEFRPIWKGQAAACRQS